MSSVAFASGMVGLSIALTGCGTETRGPEQATASTAGPAEAALSTLDMASAAFSFTTEHTSHDSTWGYEPGERGDVFRGVADFDGHRVSVGDDQDSAVIDGTTIYYRQPEIDPRWRKLDPAMNPAEQFVGLTFARMDPVAILETLAEARGLSAPFAAVGKETTGGVETTHYLGAAHEAEMARALVRGIPYESLLESGAMPDEISPVHVWVDSDGLVRKVTYELGAFRSLLGGERAIIELSDFGTTVDVEMPSADEIFEGGG